MTDALLAIEGLEAARGRFRLGPLSLRVAAGDRLAVLGPNGAGKTTLLDACVGRLAPSAGTVRLGGVSPSEAPRRELARRVALLRQQPDVAFTLPVLDVVLHGRWAHLTGLRFPGEADLRLARAMLARVGLEGVEQRDLGSLSGGERQRVFLARALVQESPLLLLDEPTASQDLHQRVAVHELLSAAGDAGRALVLVTHDLDLAAALATHGLLLRDGRVVAQGTIEDVLTEAHLQEAFRHPIRVSRTPEGLLSIRPSWGATPASTERES